MIACFEMSFPPAILSDSEASEDRHGISRFTTGAIRNVLASQEIVENRIALSDLLRIFVGSFSRYGGRR